MAASNALFSIMNVSNPEGLKARLAEIAPWVSLELQDGEWLLIAPSATTTKEVADRLGFSGEESRDTAMIFRVESYFGRNYQTVWEWISTKQGAELAIAASA